MWEYACGNTFGGTAFSSYGGFWLSYAVILTPAVSTASFHLALAELPLSNPALFAIQMTDK
jgi:succinate-acetate transporter protein